MNLTVNGVAHEVESAALTTLLDVLREELGDHEPEGRAASRAAAAPAPCSSTASRSARASRPWPRSTAPR